MTNHYLLLQCNSPSFFCTFHSVCFDKWSIFFILIYWSCCFIWLWLGWPCFVIRNQITCGNFLLTERHNFTLFQYDLVFRIIKKLLEGCFKLGKVRVSGSTNVIYIDRYTFFFKWKYVKCGMCVNKWLTFLKSEFCYLNFQNV